MKNRLRIFKTMFLANAKEFYRDSGALFWTLAFPILFTFIFGIVFSGGGDPSYGIGIATNSDNPMTKAVVEGISSVPIFKVETGTKEDEMKALEQGHRTLVVVMPTVDPDHFQAGKKLDIKIYYNGTEQNTSRALIPAIQQVFAEAERKVTGRPEIFNVELEPVQTRELTSFDYLLPGILAMALMQLGLFGVFDFMNLRDKEVIRGLAVTPLPRSTIFQSEVLLRLLIALVQTILIVLVGQIVFNVQIIGNPLLVVGLVIFGALTFVSLGYMLASFSKSFETGRNIIQLVQFPMMFLSGIFFPVEFMPDYIRPVVKAIPLTYLGDALRQVMVGAPPDHPITSNVAVLGGWLAVSSILAVKFWKWE